MRRAHVGGLKFLAHRRNVSPAIFFPFGRRIHHANADQHEGADDEHQNGVVQKVHVHEPADGAGIIMPGPIQHFETKRTVPRTNPTKSELMAP